MLWVWEGTVKKARTEAEAGGGGGRSVKIRSEVSVPFESCVAVWGTKFRIGAY